jgi:hypothetical protein
MNKLIRIFSYVLMILGALIVLGGLGSGIFMLFARIPRMMEHSFPAVRMMGCCCIFWRKSADQRQNRNRNCRLNQSGQENPRR